MVNGFAAVGRPPGRRPDVRRAGPHSIRRGNLYPIMPRRSGPSDPELHHAMLGMTETGSVCLASDDESEQPEAPPGLVRPARPRPRRQGGRPGRRDRCRPGQVGELCLPGSRPDGGLRGTGAPRDLRPPTAGTTPVTCSTATRTGFLYFHGRHSDMIKTAGANVSPREVERPILEVSGLASHVVGVDDEAAASWWRALLRCTGRERGRRRPRRHVSGSALRLQGAQAGVVVPDGRGAHDVERQARPAGAQGALPCGLRPRPFPRCWLAGARPTATCRPSSPRTGPSPTGSWTTPARHVAARLAAAGVVKGRPGGAAGAERDRVGDRRAGGDADRGRPGAPQHPAPSPRVAGATAARVGHRTW